MIGGTGLTWHLSGDDGARVVWRGIVTSRLDQTGFEDDNLRAKEGDGVGARVKGDDDNLDFFLREGLASKPCSSSLIP